MLHHIDDLLKNIPPLRGCPGLRSQLEGRIFGVVLFCNSDYNYQNDEELLKILRKGKYEEIEQWISETFPELEDYSGLSEGFLEIADEMGLEVGTGEEEGACD